ncbi:MAG: sigma-70 family RNA polymerase sigma factor [Opitutaceae bacterium]|nr:sigma-70 family RNA polymerase sigma factor [Opitutaceae bacterium]
MTPPPTTPTSIDASPSPTFDQSRWFTQEVYAHDSQLKSYLRGSFPSVSDVEDIAQESYRRIWKVSATETIRSAKGILFHIARRVATDLLRREKAAPFRSVADATRLAVFDGKPDAAEVACTREELTVLADAIDALPARCREVFILRKIKRVPQKEIARLLGISEQTVQVLVLRGMKRCEKYLLRRGL